MEEIGKLFITIIISVITIIIGSFILELYWEWFIHTIFNYRNLNLVECAALLVFISFIKVKIPKRKEVKVEDEDMEEVFYSFKMYFIFCLVALGIGYIIHLMM